MEVDVIKVSDNSKDIDETIKLLKENYVLVGIPQKDAKRKNEKVTNAELLYIHTNGSKVNKIPARPVIEPAISRSVDKFNSLFKKAITSAFDLNKENFFGNLGQIGMKAQNITRGWFTNPENGWKPNSPAVIKAKLKKGSDDPKPLIDTGELRKSITYVIVKNGVDE